jgi:N-acetylneuraminic acid mutarotase
MPDNGSSSRKLMSKSLVVILLLTFLTSGVPAAEHKWDALPVALSNNAVAAAKVSKDLFLYSFMGIGEKKTWDAITNRAFALNTETGKWSEIRPVPGPAGRLAASAVTVKDVIYLLGGYTVVANGEELSVPSVEVLLPSRGIWYRGTDMPIPLDNSVIGAYRDRYIYTLGGWSHTHAVQNVQVYDTQKNVWKEATPIPGAAIFGHAGALVNDTIIYIDGAYKNPSGESPAYLLSEECWIGKIDRHDLTKIQWTKIANHPGKPRYRMAAGVSERDQKIYFSGGGEELYDYKGVGADGRPVEPSSVTFAWNLRTSKWEIISDKTPAPTLDNRGLLVTPAGLVRIGGMEAGQKVTTRVTAMPLKEKK